MTQGQAHAYFTDGPLVFRCPGVRPGALQTLGPQVSLGWVSREHVDFSLFLDVGGLE